MGVTELQSYGLVIRDGLYDILAAEPFFHDYVKRKTKTLPLRPENLPSLGIYVIDETMLPDGDGNTGDIRFSHTLRLGFSAMVAENDETIAEQTIDAAYWKIMNRLWRDGHLMNVLLSSLPDNVQIESLPRGFRRHVFGAVSLNNETPVAELQYEVSTFFRSSWDPIITDTLDEIQVRTGVKSGDTPEQMARRKQTGTQIIFTAQEEQRSGRYGRRR